VGDLGEILSAMVAQKDRVPDRRELLMDMSDLIVKSVSHAFGCKADEVAILLLTHDGGQLRFIAPRKFVSLGTIPVSKRDSIATAALNKRSGDVINNVPQVKHVSFFESVKIRDKPSGPIQKMITTPLLTQKGPIGVVQISRKGNTPVEAGPDFSPDDLKKAQDIFRVIAPLLAEARPADF